MTAVKSWVAAVLLQSHLLVLQQGDSSCAGHLDIASCAGCANVPLVQGLCKAAALLQMLQGKHSTCERHDAGERLSVQSF